MIDTIENKYGRQYKVKIELPFNNICAISHLPDSGVLFIKYIPASMLLELISLKRYILTFHDKEVIQEQFTQQIYEDIKKAVAPNKLGVSTKTKIQATEGGVLTIKFGDI